MGAVLLVLGAAALAAEPAGRALFDAAGCRACHRVGDRGGNSGPDLSLVGVRRSSDWLRRWLASPLSWKSDTRMPEPRLRPAAREALVEYLASLRGEAYGSAPPWRRPHASAEGAALGRLIYERTGCVACHGPQGVGGHPNNNVPGGRVPALKELAHTYTEGELVDRIRKGRRPERENPSGPEPLVAMPAWESVLNEGELRAVAAYLKTFVPVMTEDW